jgi:hypothetical protein
MRKFSLLLIPLILLACTNYKYTFTKKVEAKIIGRTHNCIGITYDLYGIEVNQDVCGVTKAKMDFFRNMDTIPLVASIEGVDDEAVGTSLTIILAYKDENFADSKSSPNLKPDIFLELVKSIPDFTWFAYNGVEYSNGLTPEQLEKELSKKEKKDKKEDKKAESKPKEEKSL